MRFFHRTTIKNARAILVHGFRPGHHLNHGVWVSDVPLDAQDSISGEILFRLELPAKLISPYEVWQGRNYREWEVPAKLLNQHLNGLRVIDDLSDGPSRPARNVEAYLAKWDAIRERQRMFKTL